MRRRVSRQAKAREFGKKAREEIYRRDGGACIFCRMDYHREDAAWLGLRTMGIMHYIPRAKNGLGIPQNGALGCQYHHEMMDNGRQGRRGEMLALFRKYLQGKYPDWNENNLVYDKWRWEK